MLNVENSIYQKSNNVPIISDEPFKADNSQSSEFNFEDFIDILNPLQHIPIVSQIYKNETNDDISNDAKAIGDVFYGLLSGGIFGVFSAIGNAILKNETDKDFSEHLIAMVSEDHQSPEIPTDNVTTIINNEKASLASTSQNNNYNSANLNEDPWSIRMKQIYGDDYS